MVRAQGLRVALAATVPATTVAEITLPALLRHELRWARTTRYLAPLGFAASVVQYPLVWAALAILLAAATAGMLWALTIAAMVWAARACAASGIDAALGLPPSLPIALLPLREALSFGILLAAFAGHRVLWRGEVLAVAAPPPFAGEQLP
ncbi:MAG TPA: ceramide glucosyltransferase, partial [Acetobacteraceae bacterium]|nr:ceramide glucosyltransferase [Acetobacteraceae bacterium]